MLFMEMTVDNRQNGISFPSVTTRKEIKVVNQSKMPGFFWHSQKNLRRLEISQLQLCPHIFARFEVNDPEQVEGQVHLCRRIPLLGLKKEKNYLFIKERILHTKKKSIYVPTKGHKQGKVY